ncbi:MAG: hypothetical protein KDB58_06180 [Solirubrobacterales bacterium]|nr:hypothetical protein [Solirubrobacterales bacterium]MCB1009175.1 hypothetical protein [Acidobacteriota bacterium]MCB8969569.1 hypothetical protein [Thermoleophilales bacterium]MCO5326626.1 hypothetical protein [Solirubrobacterales bacterium]
MTATVAKPAAERAVAMLVEMSADLRACALLGPGDEVLACSSEAPWAEQVDELWSAAEDARRAPQPPTQVHVGSEGGEVFALRDGGVTAVAVTDRFTLESLMFCDLRAALRELTGSDA